MFLQIPASMENIYNYFIWMFLQIPASMMAKQSGLKMKIHIVGNTFACNNGDSGTASMAGANDNLIIDTGEKPFACNRCNKEFSTEQLLHDHISSLCRENWLSCTKCTKQFSTRYYYNRHMKTHAKAYSCMYMCMFCKRKFAKKAQLKQHMKFHDDGEKPYVCFHCNQQFRRIEVLKKHMKQHYDRLIESFSCVDCNQQFVSAIALFTHIQQTHYSKLFDNISDFNALINELNCPEVKLNIDKPFECEICSRSFSSREETSRCFNKHKNFDEIWTRLARPMLGCFFLWSMKKRSLTSRVFTFSWMLLTWNAEYFLYNLHVLKGTHREWWWKTVYMMPVM